MHLNESACVENEPECVNSFFFITNFHQVIKYHELVPTVKGEIYYSLDHNIL